MTDLFPSQTKGEFIMFIDKELGIVRVGGWVMKRLKFHVEGGYWLDHYSMKDH